MEIDNKNIDHPSIIRPTHEIKVKISVPSPNTPEAEISTIFVLKEIHKERIGEDYDVEERIVISFRYINPIDDAEAYKSFGLDISHISRKFDLSQISQYFQIYMSSEVADAFARVISDKIPLTQEIENITFFIPEEVRDNLKFEEEHWLVALKQLVFFEGVLQLGFIHTHTIRKEENIKDILKNMANKRDMIEVHSLFNDFSEKALEIGMDIQLDPIVLSNTTEEMLEKMLAIEHIGDDYLKIPQDPITSINLSMSQNDADSFSSLISSLSII